MYTAYGLNELKMDFSISKPTVPNNLFHLFFVGSHHCSIEMKKRNCEHGGQNFFIHKNKLEQKKEDSIN